MVAINTNDIIAESTDLGTTKVASRKDIATPVVTAGMRVARILDRVALLSLPCYGVAEHRVAAKAKLAVAHAIMNADRVTGKYGTPGATRLNRGMVY